MKIEKPIIGDNLLVIDYLEDDIFSYKNMFKMIINLNDSDIINMILAKDYSDSPEEIIRQKIENFRLGM